MLLGAVQIRNKRYVDKKTVFSAHLKGNLPYRFYKRLRFDIAYRAADFGYYHIGVGVLADVIYKLFYLVCNMRNYLNGRA